MTSSRRGDRERLEVDAAQPIWPEDEVELDDPVTADRDGPLPVRRAALFRVAAPEIFTDPERAAATRPVFELRVA